MTHADDTKAVRVALLTGEPLTEAQAEWLYRFVTKVAALAEVEEETPDTTAFFAPLRLSRLLARYREPVAAAPVGEEQTT